MTAARGLSDDSSSTPHDGSVETRTPSERDLREPGLPEQDRRILAFEQEWWRHAGAKEEAIRSEFGLSAARYYQLLNATLDRPEALVFDPMLVRRLRRLREARTDARSARTLGAQPTSSDPLNHK